MSSPTLIFKKAPIVSLQGKPTLLFNGQQPTLLDALEIKKVRIFFECRSGFCGGCKTKILSGHVRYITEPLAVLEADECLPCCCVPETDLNLALSAKGAETVSRSPSSSRPVDPITTAGAITPSV